MNHRESVFTKFYQSYYLPKKFGFDKRRAHLSDQINSRHIERVRALELLAEPVYESVSEEKKELNYICNNLGINVDDMAAFINAPNIPQEFYGVNMPFGSFFDRVTKQLLETLRKIKKLIR